MIEHQCMCVCVCVLPTDARELLPDCRSSYLPAGRWRCHYGTWFPPWGRPPAPAANSPTQSYLCMKNDWQRTQKEKFE